MPESRLPRPRDLVRWVTVFALTIVGAATLLGNRIHATGNDAVFTQSLVNRAARFGGTYYENGITPKGPFEDVAHDLALRIGGYDGHWYVISVLIALSCVLIAAAAASTAIATGASRVVAFAVGVAVYLHFALSDAPYAGLLYSRNILVTLLAVAWMLTLDDRPWRMPRTRLWTAIATGALLGFGVQTILPSFVDASAIGIAALVLVSTRVEAADARRKLRWATVGSAFGAFVAAPIWYLVRGSFPEFWASWWTYASYQSSGIGLSAGQQIGRGWHNAYIYYQARPLLFLLLAAFIGFTVSAWPRFDFKVRVTHLALLGWLLGGWFELVTGERYSTHYFVVIATPSAMIAAALAGHAWTAVAAWPRLSRTAIAWPLIALLLSLYLSAGTTERFETAASITSGFTSARRGAELTRENQPGPDRSVQAVLDLVSRDRDPLLLYDDNQFLYPDYRRIPATRFQQRYFLVGSIYLGRTSPKYVLKDTWKWFDEDLRQSNPAAFLETGEIDSEEFADYVDDHFEPAFDGQSGTVQLRDDVAASVLRGPTDRGWTPPDEPNNGPGWTAATGTARYAQTSTAAADDRLVLATQQCQRIDGTLDTPRLVFHLEDWTGEQLEVQLVVDETSVTTEDGNGTIRETVSRPAPEDDGPQASARSSFALVLGERSAALVMNGRIVGAVELPERTRVTVEPTTSSLAMTDLRVGAPPIGSGCPAAG
jgi:hypothetical protein